MFRHTTRIKTTLVGALHLDEGRDPSRNRQPPGEKDETPIKPCG